MAVCPPNTALTNAKTLQGYSDEQIRLVIIAASRALLQNQSPGFNDSVANITSTLVWQQTVPFDFQAIKIIIYQCLCFFLTHSTCPVNTALVQGAAFQGVSERELMTSIAELITIIPGAGPLPNPSKDYAVLSETLQWVAIAVILNFAATVGAGTGAGNLHDNAKTLEGADSYQQLIGITQEACNA